MKNNTTISRYRYYIVFFCEKLAR